MNPKRETAMNPLDVRIILAALWVAGMISSLNGDTYRLSAAAAPLNAGHGLLTGMATMLVGHVIMGVLTLTLPPSASRKANRIAGAFYALVVSAFWVVMLVSRLPGYEAVWATAQLAFALLVVWYAWRWAAPESQA